MRTFSVEQRVVHTEPFLDWLREHGITPEDTDPPSTSTFTVPLLVPCPA